MTSFPTRVVVTVAALSAVAITALLLGQTEIAAAAGGALAGYLGKVNGSGT